MMASRIRIEIHAGLCNRMRALDSAMQLARTNDSRLDVVWDLDRNFNCRFEELFDMPDIIHALVNRDVRSRARRFVAKSTWINRLRSANCYYQQDIERLLQADADFATLTRGTTTFISTYSRFYSPGNSFSGLRVREELMRIIRSYTDSFEQVTGVHIRRSDNIKATQNSPTPLFIDAMQRELDEQPDSRFFLATDSPGVERELLEIFRERIITHKKSSLERDDPAAIKDAIIDLYCLASCSKILGSYWSSFTETAAEINSVEKVIVKVPDH